MKKCVIYARFSPRKNSDTCQSNEIQIAYCEQQAAHAGYEVVKIFEDESVSGKDEFRPKLWSAIEATPKGGVLLVYKRDRLARSVYLAECINRAVERKGATIEAVSGDVEGDGPESVLIRQVVAAIAEYERMIISQRTSSSMLHYVRTGGRKIGRYPPYGWMENPEDPENWMECPQEKKIIERIKQIYPEVGSCHATAIQLGKEGVPPRGTRWHTKTVWKILKREDVIE